MMDLAKNTVLIVDDEPDLREILRDEFKELGFRVLEADSGKSAFQIVQTDKPDIVISDIRMVDGSGLELLENIRLLNPSLPKVILVTGFADLSRAETYDKGADGIIAKPFDLDNLTQTTINHLIPTENRWRIQDHSKGLKKFTSLWPTFHEAVASGAFCLGRGGIFLMVEQSFPIVNESIAFEIEFADKGIVKGSGICRWVRLKPQENQRPGIGVEFISLDETSRSLILKLLSEHPTSAFIPRGRYLLN